MAKLFKDKADMRVHRIRIYDYDRNIIVRLLRAHLEELRQQKDQAVTATEKALYKLEYEDTKELIEKMTQNYFVRPGH